ncbi:ATP-dependent zinc protease family protein [Botrimarina colliarenosi]|uniref:ATP-dependent zinc protease family protein n=1 Tax=Botrimarina colliarenosi TaxID=2528001 RepID=UPI0018D27B05|nr:RimK/LysX family protein [Botrimarina colliarenosi]
MIVAALLLAAPLGSVAIGADDPISEKVDESIPPEESAPLDCPEGEEKAVIGATADFVEKSSGFRYTARVDTGATTCSIHASKVRVEDAEKSMLKNVGKKVSFELESDNGKKKRVSTTIADTIRVKTSDAKERRYKVWLTLLHGGVERRVHVTLNDRSHMEFPLLIGRNFLCGKFVVDVAEEHSDGAIAASAEAKSAGDGG